MVQTLNLFYPTVSRTVPPKAVWCWDDNWYLISEFESMALAASKYGVSVGAIQYACRHHLAKSGGMRWSYAC